MLALYRIRRLFRALNERGAHREQVGGQDCLDAIERLAPVLERSCSPVELMVDCCRRVEDTLTSYNHSPTEAMIASQYYQDGLLVGYYGCGLTLPECPLSTICGWRLDLLEAIGGLGVLHGDSIRQQQMAHEADGGGIRPPRF